jgi:hypothetical protein
MKCFLRTAAIAFAAFLFSIKVFGQQGTVRGFVYDKATGEPMLFVNVFLKGTNFGVATDLNGYFSITRIPPGDYILMSTSIGYDTAETSITITANEVLNKKLYLSKKVISLKQVEISAAREEAKTEVQMSVTKITPREIKQVPATGGEPDLAQYLQVLPGVIFTGDQGGQLYIRGGTPVQNKVLLDGMTIYNPFHSIGLFSVFDNDIIRNADIYTGGFSADFGGRISSVMDISTRDGNKRRHAGKFSASTFNSKLLLEGPIKKLDEESGSATYLISAKTSYLDRTSKSIYKYANENGLPYRFNDLYAKTVFSADKGSKVSLFGFHFTDDVDYQASDFGWKSTGGGSNFILLPEGSAVLIEGTIDYSQYKMTLKQADEKERSSLVNGFGVDVNFGYFIGKDQIKFGFEGGGFKTDFTYYNYNNARLSQVENTTEFAGYAKYRHAGKSVVLDPSFRITYYSSLAEFAFEPRLGMKWNLTGKFRLKAAAGLYTQNLLAAVSDRDVVNLFYGFLSGPEDLPKKFKDRDVTSRLQKARHVLAGAEADLPFRLQLNVEAYLKDFNQLTNVNRDKIFNDTPDNADKPEVLRKSFIIEEGLAKGADVTLKYDYRQFYLWLVYSLTYVTRDDGVRKYFPHFDRRHNVNLVGSYTFGKKLNWEVNARWNFGSSFPFTLTQGFFEYLNFQQGINLDYTSTNGILGIIYGDLNTGRLPYYHRLDVSVKRTFAIAKNSDLEITGSVINVYDSENIFYYDRIRGERVNQLPILPAIGASITF